MPYISFSPKATKAHFDVLLLIWWVISTLLLCVARYTLQVNIIKYSSCLADLKNTLIFFVVMQWWHFKTIFESVMVRW